MPIRPGRGADLPTLTAIYNHYVTNTVVTFDVEPWSVPERERSWFVHYATTGRHRLLVATEGERIHGYVTSSPHRPKAAYETSVETTIYLAPESTGQGWGRALYEALIEELSHADVHRLLAGVALPNPPSVGLHHALGFTALGTFHEVGRKFGRYVDVLWLERGL